MAPSGFYSRELNPKDIIASGSYEEKSMNEWKELMIYNLPPDILTGEYEFQYYSASLDKWRASAPQSIKEDKFTWVISLLNDSRGCHYRYRTPEPLLPTVEDLANDYYESDAVGAFGLNNVHEAVRETMNEVDDAIEIEIKKAFIAGRESADIPPEPE